MGYIRHNAIIVTSWKKEAIDEAISKAVELDMTVIGPSDKVTNGYKSIMICPDGSKEGWRESDIGDERRSLYRQWLDSQKYDDGSTNLDWVEVVYSGDDKDASIEYHAWE